MADRRGRCIEAGLTKQEALDAAREYRKRLKNMGQADKWVVNPHPLEHGKWGLFIKER